MQVQVNKIKSKRKKGKHYLYTTKKTKLPAVTKLKNKSCMLKGDAKSFALPLHKISMIPLAISNGMHVLS